MFGTRFIIAFTWILASSSVPALAQYEYRGKIQVIWLEHGQAREVCARYGGVGTGGFVRGCACGGVKRFCGVRGRCVIYLDRTAPHHLDHEKAHCAGWEH